MTPHRPWLIPALAVLVAVAATACAAPTTPAPAATAPAPAAAQPATGAPASPSATATMAPATPATPVAPGSATTPVPAAPAAPTAAATPAPPANPLLAVSLTDVRTGQAFTLADAQAGKVLVLSPMATWCTTCTAQARQIQQLLPNDDIVVVALDVDESETAPQFAAHLQRNSIAPAQAALAPRELRQLLAQQLGPTAINTTTAPVIIVGRDGKATLLRPGVKNADTLRSELRAFLG